MALIDPASYKTISGSDNEENILSYISTALANEIKSKHEYALNSCTCKQATTCTSTGCFIGNNCIKLECILYDNKTTTENNDLLSNSGNTRK